MTPDIKIGYFVSAMAFLATGFGLGICTVEWMKPWYSRTDFLFQYKIGLCAAALLSIVGWAMTFGYL